MFRVTGPRSYPSKGRESLALSGETRRFRKKEKKKKKGNAHLLKYSLSFAAAKTSPPDLPPHPTGTPTPTASPTTTAP